MSISNDNYATGGTGGAIFGGPQGQVPVKVKPGSEALGDEYKLPAAMAGQGMTQTFDDDEYIDLSKELFDKAAEYWIQALKLAPDNYPGARNWLKVTGRFMDS